MAGTRTTMIESPLSDTALAPTVARLHRAIVRSSDRLFVHSHLSGAIFEAYKAVEVRVSAQSGISDSGRDLMSEALRADGWLKPRTVGPELCRNSCES